MSNNTVKIVLNDEDGNALEFEFLDKIIYFSNEYMVLLPCNDRQKEVGTVIILKVENEENYVSVDNEDDLKAVYDLFKARNKDDFNFAD